MSATRTTLFAALALVLTFAGGVLAGAFGHRALTHRAFAGRPDPTPPPAMRMLLHHLDRRLDLTDAQRTQIEAIFARRHARIRGEIDSANAEIERILTPEQRRRFARMKMRLGGMHAHRPGKERTAPTR